MEPNLSRPYNISKAMERGCPLPNLAGRLVRSAIPETLYDDLFDIIEAATEPTWLTNQQQTRARLVAESESAAGLVYFLLSHDTGHIKIGHAKQVKRRIAALKTASASGVSCLGVVPGSRKLESDLHKTFRPERAGGEWFRPSRHLLGFIDAWTVSESDRAALHLQYKLQPGLRADMSIAEFRAVASETLYQYHKLGTLVERNKLVEKALDLFPEAETIGEALERANATPEPPPTSPAPASALIGEDVA